MRAATVHLSRLIGVVLLIAAVLMLADRPDVTRLAPAIGDNRSALLALGLFRLLGGAAIVLIHNVWTKGLWPLTVTLCGWLLLLRGVAGLFLPREVFSATAGGLYFPEFYYLYGAIPLILGVYLGLRGFSATAKKPALSPTRSA